MKRMASVRILLMELADLGSVRGKLGQELVEYALMAGFITVSVAAFVPTQVSAPISTVFNKIWVHLVSQGG
jgi:Flp pilus assembly pilin Flp